VRFVGMPEDAASTKAWPALLRRRDLFRLWRVILVAWSIAVLLNRDAALIAAGMLLNVSLSSAFWQFGIVLAVMLLPLLIAPCLGLVTLLVIDGLRRREPA
jgi:hypothetical protein